jgi:hypothetical protein
MANKQTAAGKPTNNKPASQKAGAGERPATNSGPAAQGTAAASVAITPSVKITGVGFVGAVTPIGQIADGMVFPMTTAGPLVATGACLGFPATANVSGQLIGLDTNFSMPGTVFYNALRTRWTLIIADSLPTPPGAGTYSVALEVWFPASATLTPTDTAEFMVTI